MKGIRVNVAAMETNMVRTVTTLLFLLSIIIMTKNVVCFN